jgi:hypothetical protein
VTLHHSLVPKLGAQSEVFKLSGFLSEIRALEEGKALLRGTCRAARPD